MTNKEEIKCCPCCGAEAKATAGLVYYMIKCSKCGLNVFDVVEREAGVKRKWNKRISTL